MTKYYGNERPFTVQEIRNAIRDADQKLAERRGAMTLPPEPADSQKLLNIKTANEWLAQERLTPRPKMLFGNFWLQGELCILFADTNMGKSILAVQLGNSINRQEPIDNFEIHADPCPVLYIDFELSGKQFELRYTDGNYTYNFGPDFYRAEFNPAASLPPRYKNFGQYMYDNLKWAIKETAARILIIDNITSLSEGIEHTGQALAIMKHLKALKTQYNLSILVLAHTPKRDPAQPITRNDLGGSKMLINFADSAFAIAASHTLPGHRYLKQVKQRSGSEVYGSDNVCLCRLARREGLLHYTFTGRGHEYDHLRRLTQQSRDRYLQQAIALHQQGQTQRQIATQLNLSIGTVNKMIRGEPPKSLL